MALNSLIGTWRLVSWENRNEVGDFDYPFGRDAFGYITYTKSGFMFVAIMTSNRPHFSSDDILEGGSIEEKALAAETYLTYCGTYKIMENRIIHQIEMSMFPNWSGIDQERFFVLKGDKLILSTPLLILGGKKQTTHLVWERV